MVYHSPLRGHSGRMPCWHISKCVLPSQQTLTEAGALSTSCLNRSRLPLTLGRRFYPYSDTVCTLLTRHLPKDHASPSVARREYRNCLFTVVKNWPSLGLLSSPWAGRTLGGSYSDERHEEIQHHSGSTREPVL